MSRTWNMHTMKPICQPHGVGHGQHLNLKNGYRLGHGSNVSVPDNPATVFCTDYDLYNCLIWVSCQLFQAFVRSQVHTALSVCSHTTQSIRILETHILTFMWRPAYRPEWKHIQRFNNIWNLECFPTDSKSTDTNVLYTVHTRYPVVTLTPITQKRQP